MKYNFGWIRRLIIGCLFFGGASLIAFSLPPDPIIHGDLFAIIITGLICFDFAIIIDRKTGNDFINYINGIDGK